MEASLAIDLVVVLHLDTEFHPVRNCRRDRFRHPLRAPIEIGSKNRKSAKLAMPMVAPGPCPTGLFLIVNSVISRIEGNPLEIHGGSISEMPTDSIAAANALDCRNAIEWCLPLSQATRIILRIRGSIMNQTEFNRRVLLKSMAGIAALAAAGQLPRELFAASHELSLWCPGIAKPWKTWEPMEKRADIKLKWTVKSADAQESLQKMLIGGGQKLYDAFTDNGGGMEDAMAETKQIVPLNIRKLNNWNLLSDSVRDPNGSAGHTIRYKNQVYAIPYLSNADSMAYLPDELNFTPDSWEPLFDRQFKGRVAMQNDFGPTLTNTAIYLKQSGKVEIADASNMNPKEVKAVCQFLIGHKKAGQFRTFWTGFGDSVNLLVQKEVVMMSCWEPQVYVARKRGVYVEYGTMKEGHQVWNNVVMLSKGGKQRGKEDAFYRLCDVFLSHWYTSKQLAKFGFASLTDGVLDYIKANPEGFDIKHLTTVLENKAKRYANPGNAWQNVYPKHLEAYQEWWSRVQAA